MGEISREELIKNFISLFVIDFKMFDTQCIGIWKENGLPLIICDEVWNKDFSSRYYLIQWLTFNDVRNYAKSCVNKTSIYAQYFLDIDEHNWEQLFQSALQAAAGERYINIDRKRYYGFLVGKDIRYNVNK